MFMLYLRVFNSLVDKKFNISKFEENLKRI